MVRLREIPRTAAFAWSPSATAPSIITGTKAGAVDADFSNETQLELWDLDLGNLQQGAELQPVANVVADSRFYDVAWSQPTDDHTGGIIAGGLESGALDLWDAKTLREDSSKAHISRTTKHSGPIKSLQFNPFRHELLATAGAKGELYINDLNDASKLFRLGTAVARADDFDAVDWNKKVAHILVTGSSGGFATVWDARAKKESLTLNNLGRKPVSAIAWDPEQSTKLATATSNDQEPLILMWDLRNSNAPERTLRMHDQGILSLSWSEQDPKLLLSCGKDNRTICWNARTGEAFGEYPIVTNWTFQTKWSPRQPGLLATASFDGKIGVQTIQNTNSDSPNAAAAAPALDDADFFAQAGNQPQGATFSLPAAPKWLERPISATFGFGGKLFIVAPLDATTRTSKVSIASFVADESIGDAANQFEDVLKKGDMTTFCESKIAGAKTEEEKADWTVIETLISGSRKGLRSYLGFAPNEPEANGETSVKEPDQANGTADDDTSFFGGESADDNFLSALASTKGARTNNPFKIYTGSETDADRKITKALMLGSFEEALDVCLKEGRLSDAFMIAICGGQKCIDKAQNAYFKKKGDGPNYLRLLASVVGKNLWDVVYNADLGNWKEVLATLCTFADENEFPDLCEALGDRLEESLGTDSTITRKDASFCYLAGSKLEKVVGNWAQELQESEKTSLQEGEGDSAFSIHARVLQDFIEKVTVFRKVTKFKDPDGAKSEDWKLEPLYSKYTEYAEILASNGKLQIAERYLDLLPALYPAAEAARSRVKQATRKATAAASQRQTTTATGTTQRGQRVVPAYAPTQQAATPSTAGLGNPYAPSGASAPAQTPGSGYQPPGARQSYAPSGGYQPQGYQPPQSQAPTPYGGFQQQQYGAVPPPPRKSSASPAIVPAAQAGNIPAWNDTPDFGSKPVSRRATPAIVNAPVTSPYSTTPGGIAPPPSAPYSVQARATPPLPPPPKSGAPRLMSPPPLAQQDNRRPSSSAYAPSPAAQSFPNPQQHLPPRVASPYTPPTGTAPSNSRYAPAPGSQPTPAQQVYGAPPGGRPIAAPPTASSYAQNSYGQALTPNALPAARAPPAAAQTPPPPPKGAAIAPPPAGPPRARQRGTSTANVQLPPPQRSNSRPPTAGSQNGGQSQPKYPAGDRSHIPAGSQQLFNILETEMVRIKSKAPAQFRPQVLDTEKRLNILFDHLNNEDLLKPETIEEMNELALSIQGRQFDQAQALFTDIMTTKTEEGSNWMVGVKRLIQMSRATPL